MNRMLQSLYVILLAACGPWPSDDDATRVREQDAAPATGTVYLTFDDGPIDATGGVLDVLREHGVQATFFVNGFHLDGEGGENEDSAPEMLRRTLAEGHVVGNHSYDHMLHNCCDADGDCGAEVCNRLGTWSVDSYQDATRDAASFAPLNVERVRAHLAEGEHPGDLVDRLARLPYTNAWRVGSLRADCACCTTDDVPPWDPKSTCSDDAPSRSARVAMEVADRLSDDGYRVFGWDLEWSPTSWTGDDAAATLPSGEDFAATVMAAMDGCAATSMEPAHSRAADFPCADARQGHVVVLTHDFLFEDGPRGQGATRNLPKLSRFLELLTSHGYDFETLYEYPIGAAKTAD